MTPDDVAPVARADAAGDAAAGRADGIRRRYARWMTAYPPAWRREHGEALLGTFLDSADARGGTGPTGREAAGILRHGLAWRLRLLAPSAETRRIASLLALVTGTALALTCLLLGEWQPGVGATGWRTDPGHVGPFATLGVLVYAAWLAATVTLLVGRVKAARRLLAGAVLLAVVLGGPLFAALPLELIGVHVARPHWADILGFRRPPGWVLVSMIGLSVLALVGTLRLTRLERVLVAVGGVAGAGMLSRMALGAADGARQADPSYAFYRTGGFYRAVDLVGYQAVPLALTVAALAWWWRRSWLPAVLLWSLALLPYATPPALITRAVENWWWQLSDGASTPSAAIDSVFGWGFVLLLVVAVGRRWRRGRPDPAVPSSTVVAR